MIESWLSMCEDLGSPVPQKEKKVRKVLNEYLTFLLVGLQVNGITIFFTFFFVFQNRHVSLKFTIILIINHYHL